MMNEKKKIDFSFCPYSTQELEQFRDKDGFINLDNANITLTEGSQSQIGATDIFKRWVDFNGEKVLLKQQKLLDGEENYTLYSELVMTELANELGIRAARTDIFKFGDFKGVMSFMAFEPEKEALMMTRELVGDDAGLNTGSDTWDFAILEESIREALVSEFGLKSLEVDKLINERRKQKALQLYSCEMDNHLENEGFVYRRNEDGSYHVEVAPMFDNELSFGLENTSEDLMQDDYDDTNTYISYARPLITAYKEIKMKKTPNVKTLKFIKERSIDEISSLLQGYGAHRRRIMGNGKQLASREDTETYIGSIDVDSTLAYLNFNDDDDGTMYYFIDELRKVDMEHVIANVEAKIKAQIPQTAKRQLTTFGKMRHQAIRYIADMNNTEKESYDSAANELRSYALKYEFGAENEEDKKKIDSKEF